MKESSHCPYMFIDVKEIWKADCETFSDFENSTQVFEVKKKLWLSKQGDGDVAAYYNNMLVLCQELDLCYN